MKIVMVLMDRQSGLFQYAALLSNALSKTEQVTVIAPLGSEKAFFDASVKLILLPVGDRKRNFAFNTINPWRTTKFLMAIQREKPDIVHFHNAYVIWPCFFFPWLREYKKVVMLPDGAMLPGQHRIDKVIARKLHIKAADAIIVPSKYDKELVNRKCPDKKCYAIPHGSNSLYVEYDTTGASEKSDVLFFGGVQEYKGLEYLLEAIPIIMQRRPETRITIAAHGNIARYPQLLKPHRNIKLYSNFIPHQQVAGLFRGTEVVALPYISQVYSGVIPTAYALGKPVITTTLLSEQVDEGKTGFTVPPRDEVALAEAILAILDNDKLRANMNKNVLFKARRELSWDEIAKQTMVCYQETIEG